MKMTMQKEDVIGLSGALGWGLFAEDESQKLLRFTRDGSRIDVWYSKMTVGVLKKGETPKYHRNVNEVEFEDILSES